VSNRKQFVSDAVIDVDNSITKSLENWKNILMLKWNQLEILL
jgi:hypothetical protein